MLIADELNKLVEILPTSIKESLKKHIGNKKLLEIVMDLGRRPEARFPDKPVYLSKKIISWQDLDHCVKRIGSFSGDNRSGIEKTLHRISSIRNRKGHIIGLTCRVGRALFGTINIVRDLLSKQNSVLILGKPGVGKTTAIREIARILSDEIQKRVIVIDTSNEIAGDGDIPHSGIGRARRMQVALPELQHQVMIEAVENHMPEVIIIDEISTELEVLAARTIAERGVQLIGTVHGNFLDSLIKNPVLCDLIGGIQYVTLGDDEAKRRGTQKSILERKANPAFQVAIEIHERKSWVVHEKLDNTIDQMLQGYYSYTQYRDISWNGKISIYSKTSYPQDLSTYSSKLHESSQKVKRSKSKSIISQKGETNQFVFSKKLLTSETQNSKLNSFDINNFSVKPLHIYIYLINCFEVNRIIAMLQIPLTICKDINKADVVLASRLHVKQNLQLRQVAQSRQIRIYTIHTSTAMQITRALKRIVSSRIQDLINWQEVFKNKTKLEREALEETRAAIESIICVKKQPVQLLPRTITIRRMQQQLVNIYNFRARTFGNTSQRCLRIYLT